MLIFFLAMGSPPSVRIEQNFILASSCVVWRFSWDLFCKHFYWTQPRLLLEALFSYQNRPAKIQHLLLIRSFSLIPRRFHYTKFPEHLQIPPPQIPGVSPCSLFLCPISLSSDPTLFGYVVPIFPQSTYKIYFVSPCQGDPGMSCQPLLFTEPSDSMDCTLITISLKTNIHL